jgi:SAM-dependent methyltransferase
MRQDTCPVCFTSPSLLPIPFSRVVCTCCQVTWTYVQDELDSEALYRDEVYAIVDNRKSVFERIIFYEAQKILKKAQDIGISSNRVLDFGSGKGQFLAVAKQKGWQGMGIETEQVRAEFAREKYRVEVICGYYQGGKVSDIRVDLITLNHVLEHLPQPIQLIHALVQDNLTAEGLLYIEVPRANSWQAGIAGDAWIHWDIPKHLTHWTETGLELEFSKIGFQKVSTRSFSIHLGILGMLQALLSKVGFKENLILRLKRKKTLGLLILIGLVLPIAWGLEVVSCGFGKSGIVGIYLKRNGQLG